MSQDLSTLPNFFHRGQVATLLRQLGRKAASTDYLRFIDAQEG